MKRHHVVRVLCLLPLILLALVLGHAGPVAQSKAQPGGTPRKEVVWVRQDPVVKVTPTPPNKNGITSSVGTLEVSDFFSRETFTLKQTVDRVEYSNTITWTAPPLVVVDGEEATLQIESTSGGDDRYASVAGDWFAGDVPFKNMTGVGDVQTVGSSKNYRHSQVIKYKFRAEFGTPDKLSISVEARSNLALVEGKVYKTWNYKREERTITPPPPPANSSDLTIRIGRITGDVGVQIPNREWADAKEGMDLPDNALIQTGPESEVLLIFSDGSSVTVKDLTQVNMGTMTRKSGQIKVQLLLKIGEIKRTVEQQHTEMSDFSIQTPTATASVRGTSLTVRHDKNKAETTVSVQEGHVDVAPKNAALKAVSLKPCQQVKVSATAITAVESTGPQVTADGRGCCSHPCPDPRAAKLTLQAPELLAAKGQEVFVPVYMIKPTNVANINWTLTYDPKVVRPESVVHKGNLLDNANFFGNTAETGSVYGTFMETSGLKATTTGTVGVVRFKVLGEKGSFTPLRLVVTTVNDPGGAKLPIDLLHGSIRVVGDRDRPSGTGPSTPPGSGPVALDALTALKMSVKLIPLDMNYDVDHDNAVTSRDAVIIAKRRLDQLAKGKQ